MKPSRPFDQGTAPIDRRAASRYRSRLMSPRPAFTSGLAAALPIVLGYLPIAFSFGVAATQTGFTPVEATALSLLIYAGASQFLALALLSSGAPVLITALTLIAMNLRHLVYGPALVKAAGAEASTRRVWFWGFGLTDEVFGQALGALARGQRFSESYMFGLGIPAYAAWVGGTAIGAFAGDSALDGSPAISAALGFMLPALFLALLLSLITRPQVPIIVVAATATIAGTLALSATVGILAGIAAGAVAGVLRR